VVVITGFDHNLSTRSIIVKLAAIDIGSNAVRLLIEEVFIHKGTYHIEKVSFTRVPIRLGEDVFETGKISKEKSKQLIKTMKAFWYLMDVHNIEYFRACATSAMREAENSADVVDRIFKEANVKIEVLTGQEEANLIFANYEGNQFGGQENLLFIDVGGGSSELTVLRKSKRKNGKSFDVGTVRMLSGKVPKKRWTDINEWVVENVEIKSNPVAVGTGGNINTIFKLCGKKPNELLSYAELSAQYNLLKSLTYEERIMKFKLKPDRADVIVPAAEIYLRIMEMAGIDSMIVPKIGLSDGIILQLFNKWRNSVVKVEKLAD
jgi:exopolyphosphatase/guanosine-5'-triphosphate,3'-diphosphate pyrophosphatase